jgi:hypothetical protein
LPNFVAAFETDLTNVAFLEASHLFFGDDTFVVDFLAFDGFVMRLDAMFQAYRKAVFGLAAKDPPGRSLNGEKGPD